MKHTWATGHFLLKLSLCWELCLAGRCRFRVGSVMDRESIHSTKAHSVELLRTVVYSRFLGGAVYGFFCVGMSLESLGTLN